MTPLERRLLHFLHAYIAAHGGVAPTVREMQAEMGLASTSGVARLLASLERQQLVAREPNRARNLRLTRPPADLSAVPEREIFAEAIRRGLLPAGSQYPERGID